MLSLANLFALSRPQRISVPASIAVGLWIVLFVVISIRTTLLPGKNTVVTTYLQAGAHWVKGEDMYEGGRGFVYSPPAAAVFAPLTLMPSVLANALWRLLNAAAFLGGVGWWLKAGFHGAIPRSRYPLVFILLLPLAIGNFNNGQVNPLIIGLLTTAVVAAEQERHWLAAVCVAAATYFKIYPLAIGLLLVLLHPRRFSWRLLVALIGIGAFAFVLQRPGYVLDQYRLWLATRAADNRLEYGAEIAPRDVWLLLRLFHVSISQHVYNAFQVLAGVVLACGCLFARWKRFPSVLLGTAILALGCSWMLLFGPASESATYILLAPPVVLALVEAYARPGPAVLRTLITTSYAVFVLGLAANSFLHLKKSPATMSVQPAAAVLFVAYSVLAIRAGRASQPGMTQGSRLCPL